MSYFLSDIAEFKKRNKVKDAILGRTASGRAFRIGSLVSAGGVGTTLLMNRKAVKSFLKSPQRSFTYRAGEKLHELDWQTNRKMMTNPSPQDTSNLKLDEYVEKKVPYGQGDIRKRILRENDRSFMNTGYKVKWGNVAKTAGVAGTAVAIPVGSAYAFGTKKERDRINRGVTSSVRSAHKLSNDVRGWVNTLHRTSK